MLSVVKHIQGVRPLPGAVANTQLLAFKDKTLREPGEVLSFKVSHLGLIRDLKLHLGSQKVNGNITLKRSEVMLEWVRRSFLCWHRIKSELSPAQAETAKRLLIQTVQRQLGTSRQEDVKSLHLSYKQRHKTGPEKSPSKMKSANAVPADAQLYSFSITLLAELFEFLIPGVRQSSGYKGLFKCSSLKRCSRTFKSIENPFWSLRWLNRRWLFILVRGKAAEHHSHWRAYWTQGPGLGWRLKQGEQKKMWRVCFLKWGHWET